MSKIDWSQVGTRIRYQYADRSGRNPDFNFAAQRWKDEADYYAEELSLAEIQELAACPICEAPIDEPCTGALITFHMPRRRAAGEERLRREGPRFGGESHG